MTLDFPDDAAGKEKLASDCHVNWAEGDCEEDFSFPCPVGWSIGGGGVCVAPGHYSGSCDRAVNMYDDEFKRQFATQCDVAWPCSASCAQDFGLQCPTGWASVSGVCTAPSTYTGPCVPFADLSEASASQREVYSTLCQVEFCTGSGGESRCGDWNACPDGWNHLTGGARGGYCESAAYNGPCRPLVSIDDLGRIGHAEYMKKCDVSIQCASAADGRDSSLPFISGPVGPEGDILSVNVNA